MTGNSVAFAYTDNTNSDLRFDTNGDIVWYAGSGYDGTPSYNPVSDYAYYGYDGISTNIESYAVSGNIIEYKNHVPKTADFYALDIYVPNDPILLTSYYVGGEDLYLSGYWMELNGENMSTPDDLLFYEDYHIVRWYFEKTLTSQSPIIEVFQGWVSAGYFMTTETNEIIDNDGHSLYKHHDNFAIFGNGVDEGTSVNRDIVYRLYYDSDSVVYINHTNPFNPEGETGINETTGKYYGFELDVHNYIGYEHPTFGVPFYYNYTNVIISYSVGNLTDDYYIHVYDKDDNEVGQTQGDYNQKYPKKINDWGGTYGFVPFNTGFYNITLENSDDNEICRKTIYVSANPFDTNIYTIPNPSKNNEGYNVGYWFNNDGGYPGIICCFENEEDINNYENNIYISNVENGDNTIFPYAPPSTGDFFWQLYLNRSGNYIPVGGTYKHIAIDTDINFGGITTYKLQVSGYEEYTNPFTGETYSTYGTNEMIESDSFSSNDMFLICYNHKFTFGNVKLYIDGLEWRDVSQIPYFCYIFIDNTVGEHLIQMIVDINGTETVVASHVYNIYSSSDVDVDTGILPDVDDSIGYILGLIITISVLLSPLIIAGMINSKQGKSIQIPSLAYAFSGGTGIAVSTALGFFPIWIPAFIIIVGILVGLMIYLRSNSGGGGD